MNKFLIPVLASILILGTIGLSDVWAPTKIVPSQGDPGQKFTILDTSDGRIVPGSVAIFTSSSDTTVSLKTTSSGKTAQGIVPDAPGGMYDVKFRTTSGTEIAVGTFEIDNTIPEEATINPTSGPIGTLVTITDPQGRIQQGDLMTFFIEGTNPQFGVYGENTIVSTDGTTISANVPPTVTVDIQYFVNVGPDVNSARFNSLPFFVTGLPDNPTPGI